MALKSTTHSYLAKLGFPTLDKQEIDIPVRLAIFERAQGNIYQWNSTRIEAIPRDKSLIASFYVEDRKFEGLVMGKRLAMERLDWFYALIQPDISVFYDAPLVDQLWRTWLGKVIARKWQDMGYLVIPNLVLASADNFDAAIYGIPSEHIFAVQIQANDNNPSQDAVDEQTIKRAIDILKPKIVVIYGTEARMNKLNLQEDSIIRRVHTRIDYLHSLRDGKKQQKK